MNLLAQVVDNYRALYAYRALVCFLVRKDQRSRLFGTLLGSLWRLVEPVIHMVLYYFLFVIIFQRADRFGVNPFILIMTGLVHFLFLQRALSLCCNAIHTNSAILLQIRIEPLLLTAARFAQVLQQLVIMMLLFALPFVLYGPGWSPRILWYPLILTLLLVIAWSLSLALSTATVFLRDLSQAIPLVMRVLLYLSPVIYPVVFVPGEYRAAYLCNPVAALFALLQWSLLGQPLPPMPALLGLLVFTVTCLVVGHVLYNRYKRYFTKAF